MEDGHFEKLCAFSASDEYPAYGGTTLFRLIFPRNGWHMKHPPEKPRSFSVSDEHYAYVGPALFLLTHLGKLLLTM